MPTSYFRQSLPLLPLLLVPLLLAPFRSNYTRMKGMFFSIREWLNMFERGSRLYGGVAAGFTTPCRCETHLVQLALQSDHSFLLYTATQHNAYSLRHRYGVGWHDTTPEGKSTRHYYNTVNPTNRTRILLCSTR